MKEVDIFTAIVANHLLFYLLLLGCKTQAHIPSSLSDKISKKPQVKKKDN